MLTCSFFVFREISPEVGGALFLGVIWTPVEGRLGCLRYFEFLSLKSGPRENIENAQALICNFLKISSLVIKYELQ